MRSRIILFALLLVSLSVPAQDKPADFGNLFIIGKVQFVQSNCNGEPKVKFNQVCMDTLICRTDSIFCTSNPVYFYLKSYDSGHHLRVTACIHVHLKSMVLCDLPDAETLFSPMFQSCLFFENHTIYDSNGNTMIEALACCHYYFFGLPGWKDFGTDEFGGINIITEEQIKRMPLSR